MSEAKILSDESGMRLDKYLKKQYPRIPYTMMQKFFRKRLVKIDGKRAKADVIVEAGQVVRIPDINMDKSTDSEKPKNKISQQDAENYFSDKILYEDRNIIALNKPAGIPVQGGSGVRLCIDDMLPYLSEGNRCRLVHRIDKDTSGILLIAKNLDTAKVLTQCFKDRIVEKNYLAIVVGLPEIREGMIDLRLSIWGDNGTAEKTIIDDKGKKAITYYKVLDNASRAISLISLFPETGRKHQLRVHLPAIGCPILGDGKYGGKEAFIDGVSKKMHLHAWKLQLETKIGKSKVKLDLEAPLPKHIKNTIKMFELEI